MFKRRAERRQQHCEHPNANRTTNFGLERVTCPDCGWIEVRNLPVVGVVSEMGGVAAV